MNQEYENIHQKVYLVLASIAFLMFVVIPVEIKEFFYVLRIFWVLFIAIYLRCANDSEDEKHVWKCISNFWTGAAIYITFNMFREYKFVNLYAVVCCVLGY